FTATRSPTFTPCAWAPTSATSPAISQPVQKGRGVLRAGMPSRTKRSRWLSAHARTFTSTSLGLIFGSGTSCNFSLSGPPNSLNASAFIPLSLISPSGRFRARRSANLPVELLYEMREPGIVERGRLVGLVERRAVEQAGIALPDLAPDVLVGARDRVRLDHLVGDEIGHALPVALHRLAMERRHQLLPAAGRQDGLVGARRGVERD